MGKESRRSCVLSYTAANLQGLTKILFLSRLCVIFFCRGLNSAHISAVGESHQIHPALQVIIFKVHFCAVCGEMDSVLLREASGHYSNKSGEFVIKV